MPRLRHPGEAMEKITANIREATEAEVGVRLVCKKAECLR